MADLLGAANRVPGYDSANNNRALPTEMRPSQTQIQNVPDPTRVGRPDARTDQQGANDALQSDVLRYDSNLQTSLQRLRELPRPGWGDGETWGHFLVNPGATLFILAALWVVVRYLSL